MMFAIHGGATAQVDDEDADLATNKWYPWTTPAHRSTYAIKNGTGPRKLHRIVMARVLGRALLPSEHVDHVNGDGLDNRRANLRVASHTENHRNQRPSRNTSSRYKGVARTRTGRPWESYIRVDRKLIRLGRFDDETEAARAYDRAARRYFGAFARPNFPEDA